MTPYCTCPSATPAIETHQAGIPVTVIPGITAAMGAAAAAGIPLTHRDCAQAVTLVTGRPKPGGVEADWGALARSNHTVVVYMGVGAAPRIQEALVGQGRSGATPVAIVQEATRPTQRVVRGRLGGLAALVEATGVRPPALLIIGEVAAQGVRSEARRAAV